MCRWWAMELLWLTLVISVFTICIWFFLVYSFQYYAFLRYCQLKIEIFLHPKQIYKKICFGFPLYNFKNFLQRCSTILVSDWSIERVHNDQVAMQIEQWLQKFSTKKFYGKNSSKNLAARFDFSGVIMLMFRAFQVESNNCHKNFKKIL